MQKFAASENDGTLYIGPRVKEPAQGTWISDEGNIVAKGIVRPLLQDYSSKEIEEESSCIEAAFKQELKGKGRFFVAKEIGRENCSLNLQTVLFSVNDPAGMIQEDNARFEAKSALDFMNPTSREKVKYGVPPALLIEQMAPWDEFRRLAVKGVRAVVYGSNLVSDGYFKLLPGSAEDLAKQLDVEVYQLIGKYFLIHRDPALPDGSSLCALKFEGVVEWFDPHCKAKHGVVLNPQEPGWKAAGGDFDGDSAEVLKPTKHLLPRGFIGRYDYKLPGRKEYVSQDIGDQIAEASANTVTGLLGPTILSAMRLVERGVADNQLRGILAGVAQASVQAKKHPVDYQTVSDLFAFIREKVNQYSAVYPFISDFINNLKNKKGVEEKIAVWKELVAYVKDGTWDHGSDIERALVNRVLVLDNLFNDVGYFQAQKEIALPSPIRDAAKILCSETARLGVQALAKEYRKKIQELRTDEEPRYEEETIEQQNIFEGIRAGIKNDIRIIRGQFKLASITGDLPTGNVTPRDAQLALVAFGPAAIAARFVEASLFKELGTTCSRLITQLIGHDWTNKRYLVKDIKPIDKLLNEYKLFSKDKEYVQLEVLNKAKQTTRVMLTG